jgi:hypothetical protein
MSVFTTSAPRSASARAAGESGFPRDRAYGESAFRVIQNGAREATALRARRSNDRK